MARPKYNHGIPYTRGMEKQSRIRARHRRTVLFLERQGMPMGKVAEYMDLPLTYILQLRE